MSSSQDQPLRAQRRTENRKDMMEDSAQTVSSKDTDNLEVF